MFKKLSAYILIFILLPRVAWAEPAIPAVDQQSAFDTYSKKAIQSLKEHKLQDSTHFFYLASTYAKDQAQLDALFDDQIKYHREAALAIVDETAQFLESYQPGAQAETIEYQVPIVQEPPPIYALATSMKRLSFPSRQVKTITKNMYIGSVERARLDEIAFTQKARNVLKVVMGDTVIIEGENFKRFLLIDQGVIDVVILNPSQLQIKALRRGTTFLHVWDEKGRRTLYVEASLPNTPYNEVVVADEPVEHAQAFKFTYANDFTNYYSGNKLSKMERQSNSFLQYIGIDGQTPYGYFDSSATILGFDKIDDTPNFTVGLSHAPVPGTSDFNVRAFDARRTLSSLTMPGAHLRGIFTDINFFDNNVGISYSHGRLQPTFGFLTQGTANSINAYVDAARITLFPTDRDSHYSLNFATSRGEDLPEEASKKAYSFSASQRFKDLYLSGELARNDDERNSGIAGIRWDAKNFRSSLNFRNINREYSTVISAPVNQGEIGAVWSFDAGNDRLNFDSVIDVYRDRLFFNPDDSHGLNYDASSSLHAVINSRIWNDLNVYYVHTPQENSPRRNLGLNDRISYSFDTWHDRRGTAYAGGGYQKARYSTAPNSAYDRYAAIVGFQLPLSRELSLHGSYEYSWLHEPFSGDDFNPNVYSAGLMYYRQYNERFSGNYGFDYRNEQGVKGTNSFLSGEDSLGFSTSFNYSPIPDRSFFLDSRARKVWSEVRDRSSYYDLDFRLGMRLIWGPGVYWDPTGTLSGYVYKDKDGDGQKGAQEAGIANVKVNVGYEEVVTDAKGFYSTKIKGNKVRVSPQNESVPDGFIFTTPVIVKSDVVQGRTQRVDFGLTNNTSIYGVVFVDSNENGSPDSNEELINKVMVTVDGKTAITDGHGAYYFRNIGEGKHSLKIDLNSIPINMIPRVKLEQIFDIDEGATFTFNIPLRLKEEQPS